MSSKILYVLGRFLTWFYRFKSLSFAEWLFNEVESPCILTRELFGYQFSMDVSRSVTHRLLYLEGKRMIGEYFLIKSLIEPGMRVADVGANIGYYLLMFEQMLREDGEIICFEPEPNNLLELKRNIEQNRFSNIVLYEKAIGLCEGMVGLKAGINSRVLQEGEGDFTVPIVMLDSVIKERVDMIKIDVDGYEAHVLMGAKKLLDRDRPYIFLEFHPHHIRKFGYTFQDVYDLLKMYYNEITYYEIPEVSSISQKIGVRYLGLDPVHRIENIKSLIADTNSGRRQRTFWIICRSRTLTGSRRFDMAMKSHCIEKNLSSTAVEASRKNHSDDY